MSKTLQYEEDDDDDDDLLLRQAERLAMERERNVASEQPQSPTRQSPTRQQSQPQTQTQAQQREPEVLPPLTDLSQAPVLLPYKNTTTTTATASHQGRQPASHVSFFGQRSSDTPQAATTTATALHPSPSRQPQTHTPHRRVESDPSTLIAQVRTRAVHIPFRHILSMQPLHAPY